MDIFFTFPEISSTNPMEIMAPAKAARIIPPEPMGRPRLKNAIITSETTSFAPEEMPSTKGPAMGLAKKVCSRKPDTDRPPPRIAAARIRGKRISQTMRWAVSSPARRNRTRPISLTDRDTLPELRFQIINIHIKAASTANERPCLRQDRFVIKIAPICSRSASAQRVDVGHFRRIRVLLREHPVDVQDHCSQPHTFLKQIFFRAPHMAFLYRFKIGQKAAPGQQRI